MNKKKFILKPIIKGFMSGFLSCSLIVGLGLSVCLDRYDKAIVGYINDIEKLTQSLSIEREDNSHLRAKIEYLNEELDK